MKGIRTAAAELDLKTRRPTRAEVTEHVLTELSRKRALRDDESLVLETAIVLQLEDRRDRRGRRKPRLYLGAIGPQESPGPACASPEPPNLAPLPDGAEADSETILTGTGD